MDFTKFGEERIIEYDLDLSKFEDHITNTYKLLKTLDFASDSLYEHEVQTVAKICLFDYYVINFDKFRDILEESNEFTPIPDLKVPRFWYQMIQQICRPMYYGNEIYIPKIKLYDNFNLLQQPGTEISAEKFQRVIEILQEYYAKSSKSKNANPVVSIGKDPFILATPFTSFKLTDTHDVRLKHFHQKQSRNSKVLQSYVDQSNVDIPVENIDHGIIETGVVLTPDLQIPQARSKAFSALLHCRFNQIDEPSIEQLLNDEKEVNIQFGSELIHQLNLTQGFATGELINCTRVWSLPVEFDGGMTYAIYNEFPSIEEELETEKKSRLTSKPSSNLILTSNDTKVSIVKDSITDRTGLKNLVHTTNEMTLSAKDGAAAADDSHGGARDSPLQAVGTDSGRGDPVGHGDGTVESPAVINDVSADRQEPDGDQNTIQSDISLIHHQTPVKG
jgi:hypothetical protein